MNAIRLRRLRGTINRTFALLFLVVVLFPVVSFGLPTKLGDLDEDGQPTVLDIVRLINHVNGATFLASPLRGYADLNADGYINQADIDMLADAILGIPIPTIPRPIISEPSSGASEVGVTVRPRVYFPKPIVPATLNSNNFYASFAGKKLPATIVPANDGTFAWLFFETNMPNASQIQVTVDGSTISVISGEILDADADLTPGGTFSFNFSTVSVVGIPNTVVSSRIVDPGPDLIPRTADDVTLGNGFNYLLPIRGVKVYVLGMENNVAYTDADGHFTLTNMPVGDVKVVLDGRTATNPPTGYYFPEMVMDTTFAPGITNGVMNIVDANGNVVRDANGVPIRALAMYLPRVASNVLQTVSAGVTNMITLQSNAAYNLPTEQQQYLTVEIMPNSLIGMNGQPLATGQVGVSVVPPELVKDMLPPGLLQHTFDITVQAPGIATFATPAPMTFPNVFNAAPGTKLNFLSFDHTTGRLVIEGTATVSADGLSVRTDPGTGITHPGWHGLAPPGSRITIGDCFRPVSDIGKEVGYEVMLKSLAAAAEHLFSNTVLVPGTGAYASTALFHFLYGDGSQLVYGQDDGPSIDIQKNENFQEAKAQIEEALREAVRFALLIDPDNPQLSDYPAGIPGLNLYSVPFDQLTLAIGGTDPSIAEISNVRINRDGSYTADIRYEITDRYSFLTQHSTDNFLSVFAAYLEEAGLATPFTTRIDFHIPVESLIHVAPLQNSPALSGAAPIAPFLSSENPIYTIRIDDYLLRIFADLTFTVYYRVPAAEITFLIQDTGGTVRLGGTLNTASDGVFVASLSAYDVLAVWRGQLTVARKSLTTPPSGGIIGTGELLLSPAANNDSDGDGISDEVESIFGTDLNNRDTDGDGLSDLSEIQQGLDPLSGRAFATGVIASLPLPGEAKEVVLEGSILDSQQQTAFVALGSRGLGIVNASQFQMPILLGQLDLPGDATDVAVDSNLKLAAVAANSGGLHLVDVSDPLLPRLRRTIYASASQVEVIGGVAYAAVGADLLAYELATGDLLQSLPLGGGTLTGLACEGLFLYTMDASRVLRVIDLASGQMVARGSLTLPSGTGKLFVGGGIAFVSAENAATGGFATANVANPDAPTLLSDVDANNLAGQTIAPNGSGLAVAVGSPGNLGNVLDVLNVSDPANTAGFITRFPLPADPFSVTIGAGIAFVADGTAGLQVVNYRSFDNQGVPPTITLSNSFVMLTPTNGLAEEGKLVRATARVTDDVQVRHVEFFIDGTRAFSDATFPFEYRFITPALSASKTNFTLRARAFDTGGNSTWSDEITVALVPDATPPRVVRVAPYFNAIESVVGLVAAYFNEPLDPATVNEASVRLTWFGTNGTLFASNAIPVTNGVVTWITELNGAFLTFPTNLPPGLYQGQITLAATDLAGNALAGAFTWNFWVLGQQDSDFDGIPDNLEIAIGLNPNNPYSRSNGVPDGDLDLDGDGLKTRWELRWGYNPLTNKTFVAVVPGFPNENALLDGQRDPDQDGLDNVQEQARGTNPLLADTDGDGWPDEAEVHFGGDPLDPFVLPKLFVTATPPLNGLVTGFHETNVIAFGTIVAQPPLNVLVTGFNNTNAISLGTTVAFPPLNVLVTGFAEPNAITLGTMVARPPVQVEVAPQ